MNHERKLGKVVVQHRKAYQRITGRRKYHSCLQNTPQLLCTNRNGWVTVPGHHAPWLGQWDKSLSCPVLPCPPHGSSGGPPGSAPEVNVKSSNKMELGKVGRLRDSMALAWDTARSEGAKAGAVDGSLLVTVCCSLGTAGPSTSVPPFSLLCGLGLTVCVLCSFPVLLSSFPG